MGACNIEMTLKGDKNKNEVLKEFKDRQKMDANENGHQHGYSGDFQTVNRIDFHNEIFDNYNDAENYCLDNAQKWESVVAVKYLVNKETNKYDWLIAGWGAC